MKKKRILSLFIIYSTLIVSCSKNINDNSNVNIGHNEEKTYTVRFLANIPNVDLSLSSGYKFLGDNLVYETITINENELLVAPNTDPVRENYIFNGWYIDNDCTKKYDFSKKVTSNLNLYAKWERNNDIAIDDFVEPKLKFEEKIDNSINPITINGVLNSKVENNSVNLTTIGIRKLTENATNVKELLNYSINGTAKITSATYENKKITIVLENNQKEEITVNDITLNKKVNNSVYENKAVNYENKSDIDPYNVVLAGSSSMENWSSSKEDMKPLTTVNVGIGGTTANQWSECLAERLIYPFSPREVVLYVGINNIINAKNTGEETGNALIELFDNIHDHLPNTTIFYVLMNLVPNYMSYKNHIEKANEMAFKYGSNKDYMQYIDAGSLLLKETNIPNKAYFLSDGLHMSLYGYTIWGQKVKNSVIAFEREKYYGKTQN